MQITELSKENFVGDVELRNFNTFVIPFAYLQNELNLQLQFFLTINLKFENNENIEIKIERMRDGK